MHKSPVPTFQMIGIASRSVYIHAAPRLSARPRLPPNSALRIAGDVCGERRRQLSSSRTPHHPRPPPISNLHEAHRVVEPLPHQFPPTPPYPREGPKVPVPENCSTLRRRMGSVARPVAVDRPADDDHQPRPARYRVRRAIARARLRQERRRCRLVAAGLARSPMASCLDRLHPRAATSDPGREQARGRVAQGTGVSDGASIPPTVRLPAPTPGGRASLLPRTDYGGPERRQGSHPPRTGCVGTPAASSSVPSGTAAGSKPPILSPLSPRSIFARTCCQFIARSFRLGTATP